MGAKYIPITAAKRIADDYGQSQVIVVTFDKQTGLTHVVTYGGTLEECKQAAAGGNVVKKALGWPESLCVAKPARAITRVFLCGVQCPGNDLWCDLVQGHESDHEGDLGDGTRQGFRIS